VVVADPAHIRRLKGVVYVLQTFIEKNGDGNMGRMAFFMSTMVDDLSEELKDMDETTVRLYLYQIGEVISWIGHGDNDRLPDSVKEFAEIITPTVVVQNGHDDSGSSSHFELDTRSR
jgi:hypothetical protein